MDTFSSSLLLSLKDDLNDHLVFDEDHYAGLSASTVALSRQLSALVKKHEPETPAEVKLAEQRAEELFRACNKACLDFVSPSLRHMAHRVWWDFPDDWQAYLNRSTLIGPGSSIGSAGKNDFVRKFFLNDHTTTDLSLYDEFSRHIYGESRLVLKKGGSTPIVCRPLTRREPRIVDGSSFFLVPKDKRIARCAATEPFVNMALQLGVGQTINDVLLKRFGYDPKVQQHRNRCMALQGSVDGSLATIDLSSASDLIPLSLVEAMMPPTLVAAILDCRSPYVKIRSEKLALGMVSTMGCGFTFPLETLIFTLICANVAQVKGVQLTRFDSKSPNFGVFGDDIIVPSGIYDDVIAELERLGMVPNRKKSFSGDHPFRESCGGDFYKGHNVRPIYVKKTSSDADLFSAINRLVRHSCRWAYKPTGSIALLRERLKKPLYVPVCLSDTAGIHVPFQRDTKMYLEPVPEKLSLANKQGDLRLPEYDFLWSSLGGYVDGSVVLLRQQRDTKYQEKTLPKRLWDTRTSFHFELSKGAYRLIERPLSWHGELLPILGWSEHVLSVL